MYRVLRILIWGLLIPATIFVRAGNASEVLEVQKVTDNVFALVGPLGDRSPENLSNNATYGVIVTSEVSSSSTPVAPIKVLNVFTNGSDPSQRNQ